MGNHIMFCSVIFPFKCSHRPEKTEILPNFLYLIDNWNSYPCSWYFFVGYFCLSVCIVVWSYLWPIPSRIFRMYTVSLALINRATICVSTVENMSYLMICKIVCTAPLFEGGGGTVWHNPPPPDLLIPFGSFRYPESLCPANYLLIFQKVMISPSWDTQ